ncbi:MAG TPA: hypothetical protein VLG11_03485 [Candidatus Saccharimonadales bacterium]|nr:hypothetical protein [Candidatus Saccharimonadales bacterium]
MPKRSLGPTDDTDSNIAEHYEDEFDPTHGASTGSEETGAAGENAGADATRGGEEGHGALTPKGLRDAEGGVRGQIGNHENNAGEKAAKAAGEVANKLEDAAGPAGKAAKLAQKLLEKVGGKKKGILSTVLSVILVIGIVFAGGNAATHEINHFANALLKEEGKVAQHMEQKIAGNVMDSIARKIQKKLSGTQEEKQALEKEDADAKANGEKLTQAVDEFPLTTSPEFATLMDKAGMTLKYDPNGNFKGIFDSSTGEDITTKFNDFSEGAVDKLLETEFKLDQIETYRPLMTVEAGVDFNIFPVDGSKDKDPNKTLNDAVEKGASGEEISEAISEENNKPPQEGQDNSAYSEQEADSKVIRDGVKAAQDEFSKSGDAGAAQAAGVKAAGLDLKSLGNKLFIANLATTACSIKEAIATASDARVVEILKLLMRQGNELPSIAGELNAGKLKGHTVSKVVKLLQGNPGLVSAFSGKDGQDSDVTPIAALPATRSAAWHRDTGQPVNSNPHSTIYTPDIADAARPNKSGASKLVDSVQGILNLGGLGSLGCKALTSKFSIIFQAGANVVQIITNIGDFGATQAAVALGSTAAIEVLENVVLPEAISYFTVLAITGTVAPVHQINNGAAGLDASFSLFGNFLGGVGQTNANTLKLRQNATKTAMLTDMQKPWTYRTLALDNPSSLAFRLMARMPFGTQNMMSGVASYFTGFPFNIFQQLSSIVTARDPVFADSAVGNCIDAYCITTNASDDSDLDKYKMEDAEHYLFSNVSAGGKTIKRIDALGNPETYQASQDGDTNFDDLMHCFGRSTLDNLADRSDGSNDAAKKNCGSLGTFDLTNPADDPNKQPTDDTIAHIYCKSLVGNYDDGACLAQVKPQLHDDIGHYRALLGYYPIMKTFTSMTNVTN